MIRIRNWDRFQAFKDGRPIHWIKLWCDLRHNREWRRLSGDASKLLIDLWITAADSSTPGEIHDSVDDLSFDFRIGVAELQQILQELESQGFIESVRNRTNPYETVRNRALREEEEKEEEKENKLLVAGEDVENSLWVDVKKAATELGMGRLSYQDEQKNKSILTQWRYKQERQPQDILAAIRGAIQLRDEGGSWLEKGQPYTLAALFNTQTVADQGDGTAVRPLWSVAQERYYGQEKEPRSRRGYVQPERVTVDADAFKGEA